MTTIRPSTELVAAYNTLKTAHDNLHRLGVLRYIDRPKYYVDFCKAEYAMVDAGTPFFALDARHQEPGASADGPEALAELLRTEVNLNSSGAEKQVKDTNSAAYAVLRERSWERVCASESFPFLGSAHAAITGRVK